MLNFSRCVLILILTMPTSWLLATSPAAAAGCISLTALESTYTQDFDTLGNTGTASAAPTGWAFSESGSNANTTYTAGTGSGNTGDTYSFGASGSAERALGGLQSTSLIPTFGACFSNNTGGTITGLTIAYTGEEWRLGAAGRTDQLDFQYSTNAASLTTGTWNDFNSLDFITPDTITTGPKNGNTSPDRTGLAATLSALNLANGATFWIRWADFNASGADDGLAVDDFRLTPLGPVVSVAAGAAPNETGPTTGVFSLTLAAPAPPGGLTVSYNLAGSTAASPADYSLAAGANLSSLTASTFTLAAGQSSGAIVLTPVDDQVDDDGETVQLNLVAGPGYTLGAAASATHTIADNDTRGVTVSQAGGVAVAEGGITATYTLRLDTIPTATVTVSFNTGSQIQPIAALTFPADVSALTPQTVVVAAVDDALVEGDHSGLITHTLSGGGYEGIGSAGVSAAITDNDIAYSLTGHTPTVNPEGNAGTTPISFTLTRTGDFTHSSTIDFSLDGTAATGADYNNILPAGGVVSFAAGVTRTHITLDILGDFIDESDETIILTLSNPGGANDSGTGVISGSPSTTITIMDDDSAGFTIISPTNPITLSEPDTSAVFTLTLTSQPTAPVMVALSASPATECTVWPPALILHSGNFNTGANAAVTALDDSVTDGVQACDIVTAAAASVDPNYNGLNPPDIAVNVLDNDNPPINPQHLIFLPQLTHRAMVAPDLVIDSLSAGRSGVTVVIRNAGNAPVIDAFWVDVYFNPTQTPAFNQPWPAIAAHGQVWGVTGAGLSQLTPGGTLTLTSGGPYFFSSESSPLPLPAGANVYALADSVNFSTAYGAVPESNEDNNLFGPVLSTAGGRPPAAGLAASPSTAGLPGR